MTKQRLSGWQWHYLSGECYLFARALIERTGWPGVLLMDAISRTPVHAAVRHPEGLLLDAAGYRTEAAVAEAFGVSVPRFEPIDLAYLEAASAGGEDALPRARRWADFAVRSFAPESPCAGGAPTGTPPRGAGA